MNEWIDQLPTLNNVIELYSHSVNAGSSCSSIWPSQMLALTNAEGLLSVGLNACVYFYKAFFWRYYLTPIYIFLIVHSSSLTQSLLFFFISQLNPVYFNDRDSFLNILLLYHYYIRYIFIIFILFFKCEEVFNI